MWKRLLAIVITLALLLMTTAGSSEQNPWDCPGCGKTGNTGNFCGKCGHPAPAPTPEPKPTIAVEQSVFFGHYPQTSTGKDNTPIEWLVLDYDAKNNKALLISRYALDCMPYNTTYKNVTWETCTLQKWLNSTFLDNAFNSEEKKAILKTTVDNSKKQGASYSANGGNNTRDKVFLLSYAEAGKYFKNDDARKCAPTDYAIKQGVWTTSSYKANGRATCWWWLRSPGYDQLDAAYVISDGSRYDSSVNLTRGVRPALWLDLTSDIF